MYSHSKIPTKHSKKRLPCSKMSTKNSKTLTKKQEMFVNEYLIDMNATQAYKRAGYGAKDDKVANICAIKLLGNTRVKEAIEKAIAEKKKRNEITADWVVAQLKKNYERCMQAIPVFDKSGEFTGEFRYEPNAANRALELLGKHVGMFTEKLEGKIEVDDKRPLKEATEEELKLMLAKVRSFKKKKSHE
jgi:phage terminase small subunit